jgi:hypothetical protein
LRERLAILVGLNTRFSVGNSPAYRVLFPASHLQPYDRSTEGGLFGSIGFYHLTARQSSTVIEVRFVDFRRLGSFRTSISGEAGSFMICCSAFLHKYKTDIHTKDATRSVWKCDQFSPTPTRFAARAKGPLDLTTDNIWVNLGGATRHFATRLARHTHTSPVRIAPSIGQRRIGIDQIVAR